MATGMDHSKIAEIDHMAGEDDDETQELRTLYAKAHAFIASFKWCQGIKKAYFGLGVDKIIAVFLFELNPALESVDSLLWVIVGDIPPAYIVTDDAPNPRQALAVYIGLMREWVNAVKAGKSVRDLVPVNAAPTEENANDLERRLEFLEEEILKTDLG